METKRESLNTLLDWQLSLVVKLHRGMANHDITKESCLSGDLLNALLGVEALVNTISALPLTPEEQGQVIGSPKGQFVSPSRQFIEQSNEQDAIQDKITQTYGSKALDRMGWKTSVDKIPSNREPTHSFDDDDAGW